MEDIVPNRIDVTVDASWLHTTAVAIPNMAATAST
jgi:hypothetical protein